MPSFRFPGMNPPFFPPVDFPSRMNQTVSLRRRPDPRLVLERNRALLPRATCYAYQTINGQDLEAYVFPASGEAPEDGRPVVLFFYSSG